MQKKTFSFLTLVFIVQVVLPGLAAAQAEKTPYRPWLLWISI